jgi:hypothetical protein
MKRITKHIYQLVAAGLIIGMVGTAHAAKVNGTVSGSLVNRYAGPCDADYGYCASGDCFCDVFQGSVNGKPIGRGNAELDLTVDNGATLNSGGPSCTPMYGTLLIETNVDNEEIFTTGTSCNGGPGFIISGGWAIAASDVGAQAFGTAFSGTFNPNNGAGTIKYSGNTY